MASKKPSLTKQIAEALETDDKREQLERINGLKRLAQSPPVAVIVMLTPAGVRVNALSDVNITVDDAKFVLQKGVDYLTEEAVKAKLQQTEEPPDADPAEIREQLQKYADENPDKQVFDGEHLPVPPRTPKKGS